MAQIEKTREVTETYLVTVCDGCESEDVTTNDGDKVYCDSCFNNKDKKSAKAEDTQQVSTEDVATS